MQTDLATVSNVEIITRIKNSVANPRPDPIALNGVNTDGDWVRQGDVYIRIISAPVGKLQVDPDFKGQLAEGNTRGSRHIIDNLEAVVAYINPHKDISKGPILQVLKDCEVTHPDHGHVKLGANIWVEVTYQTNFFAQERRRVAD
jgi:hypothetical protein